MNSQRIPIYFTSDLHIGHFNCLALDGRPFDSLDAMHRGLIKRWNATVPKNAIIYVLGDVGLCKGATIASVINKMNGTKISMRGNHDGGINTMLNNGFSAVLNTASITVAGEIVTMSHCPLRGVRREDTSEMKGTTPEDNWHGESKHLGLSIEDKGQFHLHGHIHSPNGGKSTKILGRQMDVGVVGNNYTPISISQIESWIALTKKEEKINGHC